MEEYEARLATVRRIMAAEGLDALIVCGDLGHPGDVRWLANWRPGVGNAFLFVPLAGEPGLVLHDEVPGFDLCATWVREIVPPARGEGSLAAAGSNLAGLLGDHGARRLGVAGETGLPMAVQAEITATLPRLEMSDVSAALLRARAVKSPREVAMLREAVRQTDEALSAAVAAAREGVTERQVVAEALRTMVLAGSEEPAFSPLVVAGPRARWKHATPSDRPIGRGEPVYMDMGACHLGYCADLSRTMLLGRPTAEQARRLEFALEATATVREAARPGVPARRLREAGDEVAAHYGLSATAWGTGHGIGCKLREEPLLDPTNELLLAPGMVIAIEPMCVSEHGTFVVEDDILITETGSEYLSHCPRRNWS
jgi:Xaa-Pro aminopeptidase